jgi:hypothetical protein
VLPPASTPLLSVTPAYAYSFYLFLDCLQHGLNHPPHLVSTAQTLLLHCLRAPANTSTKSVRLNSLSASLHILSLLLIQTFIAPVSRDEENDRREATDLAGEILRSGHICGTLLGLFYVPKLVGPTQCSPCVYDRGRVSPRDSLTRFIEKGFFC